ncbi:hypothetical protein CHLRE_11g476026v5 [Chlamydomonas reinhardtii]|uniref:Uncharacterized protein n=1 Tax=Chlamydomonas reinhardtii TaxID=3055 RepID=A0A2K3D8C5_CHLRE|nr:uncharacterized protein CHLRE_11g476026v5 [Chlamydomonas reinhardtii]PNW76784.1 hypothetical protein CHLRE_11g476026v5 [Chlamydomonas reinhardtii]
MARQISGDASSLLEGTVHAITRQALTSIVHSWASRKFAVGWLESVARCAANPQPGRYAGQDLASGYMSGKLLRGRGRGGGAGTGRSDDGAADTHVEQAAMMGLVAAPVVAAAAAGQ